MEESNEQENDAIRIQAKDKYKLLTIILIIALAVSVVYSFTKTSGMVVVSTSTIEQKVLNLLKDNPQVKNATLTNLTIESGVYRGILIINGQPFPVFISIDGKYIFQGAVPLDQEETQQQTQEQKETNEITKSDKPKVELFVMSYCPYGTQMEKGIIPVVKLLKDKIDFTIRFVYYAMHGKKEIDENLLQYCVQKEQNDKYISYLSCFLADGNSEQCLDQAGIDRDSLESCISETDSQFKITEKYNDKSTWLNDRFPLFDIDKELNEEYGVRGSPTLVINGNVVSTARDPESILKTICQSFNNPPSECEQELSSTSPSPGFGYNEGSNSQETCG